jgi:hypothetical protein
LCHIIAKEFFFWQIIMMEDYPENERLMAAKSHHQIGLEQIVVVEKISVLHDFGQQHHLAQRTKVH